MLWPSIMDCATQGLKDIILLCSVLVHNKEVKFVLDSTGTSLIISLALGPFHNHIASYEMSGLGNQLGASPCLVYNAL